MNAPGAPMRLSLLRRPVARPDLLRLLSMRLKANGYRVSTAASAGTASIPSQAGMFD